MGDCRRTWATYKIAGPLIWGWATEDAHGWACPYVWVQPVAANGQVNRDRNTHLGARLEPCSRTTMCPFTYFGFSLLSPFTTHQCHKTAPTRFHALHTMQCTMQRHPPGYMPDLPCNAMALSTMQCTMQHHPPGYTPCVMLSMVLGRSGKMTEASSMAVLRATPLLGCSCCI
eukprot:1156875-Pelagomonas_calceolata.AAC.1